MYTKESFTKDISYEAAKRAFSGTSFVPEERAKQYIEGYCSFMESFLNEYASQVQECEKEHFFHDVETFRAKYISRVKAYLYARSQLFSTMITGASNFPVARMEKINRSVATKQEEADRCIASFRRYIAKKYFPNTSIIRSGEKGTLEALQKKLSVLENNQDLMKKANALIRYAFKKQQKPSDILPDLIEIGLSEKAAKEIVTPNYCGCFGFETFQLQNNNAEIRRIRQRIEQETKRHEQYTSGNKEHCIDGIRVVENVEENRLQLFFEGKPSAQIRDLLKSRGFRWSPTNSAWQRQLTNSAIAAFRYIRNEIKELGV